MIGILDYGVGNLLNLKNAIDYLGLTNRIICVSEELVECDRMILPGVGAFATAMKNLRASGLICSLKNRVMEGMPLLGICLGAQLLLEESSEGGTCKGLGWIPGKVCRFEHALKVPQIGWNRVSSRVNNLLFEQIPEGSYFYFVHSYYMQPQSKDFLLGITEYGHEFASVVHKDNVWGVQFHPEKSQNAGLKLLNNFCTFKLGRSFPEQRLT